MTAGATKAGNSPADPFTADGLRKLLLTKHVLRGEYKLPSGESLNRLWSAIQWQKFRWDSSSPERKARDESRLKASEALRVLISVVPHLKDRAEYLAQSIEDDHHGGDTLRAEARVLESLYTAALEVAPYIDRLQMPIRLLERRGRTPAWHDFALTLAEKFRDAVQSANPSLPRLANAKDGPVARFLKTIIPFITDEAPNDEAISRFIRRKRGDNDNS